MVNEIVDIEELVRLAYSKGHAEGVIDSLTAIDEAGENAQIKEQLEARARKTLEVMEPECSRARLEGYRI